MTDEDSQPVAQKILKIVIVKSQGMFPESGISYMETPPPKSNYKMKMFKEDNLSISTYFYHFAAGVVGRGGWLVDEKGEA